MLIETSPRVGTDDYASTQLGTLIYSVKGDLYTNDAAKDKNFVNMTTPCQCTSILLMHDVLGKEKKKSGYAL